MIKYLRKYAEKEMVEGEVSPSYLEFVRFISTMPNVLTITNEDIKNTLAKPMTVTTKRHIIKFLNFVKQLNIPVKYSGLYYAKDEEQSIPAYSDDTYLALAECLFSPQYIATHRMIERALDNHWYAEMWLYLSLHYVCGWRAADICKGWKYLQLSKKPQNSFGINKDTLYEDILYDRIPDRVYEMVCQYALNAINASGEVASKTSEVKDARLIIAISEELSTFFGLLTLIAEAVMLRTGQGYMKEHRCSAYQHKRLYGQFFGQEMVKILNGYNIHSRRLNKDYLQGIEESARKEGCGSLMASAVASFARSHGSLDTIKAYLRDHKLNGENAEMVLYYMLDRGVFAVEYFQLLLAAAPDIFYKLPMKKQNELIAAIEQSPLQIEIDYSETLVKLRLHDFFIDGETDSVIRVLKAMYEISQGRGLAKDEGIHCLRRAQGELCAYPEYGSCLSNACPYLVFTKLGFKTLLKVILQFKNAADRGDVKANSVLHHVIMPRFRDVINSFMRDVNMNQSDRNGMRKIMREMLEDGNE